MSGYDVASASCPQEPSSVGPVDAANPNDRIRKLMQSLEESATAEGRWHHRAQHFEKLYEACQVAMENAGYLGSAPDCIKELCARAEKVEAPSRTVDDPQVSEWVVLANARRICGRRYQRLPNWSLAMEAFGLGSTWAWALCKRIGVDPDGRTMDSVNEARTLADAHSKDPSRAAMPKEGSHNG